MLPLTSASSSASSSAASSSAASSSAASSSAASSSAASSLPLPAIAAGPIKGVRNRASRFSTDGTFYLKYPHINNNAESNTLIIDSLINEFIALRVVEHVAKSNHMSVNVPSVSVKMDQELQQPRLEIQCLNGRALNQIKPKTLPLAYTNALLDALILQLLTGNIDGHYGNYLLDSLDAPVFPDGTALNEENPKLNIFDFDLSFRLSGESFVEDLEKMARTCKEAFPQLGMIKSNLDRFMLRSQSLNYDGIREAVEGATADLIGSMGDAHGNTIRTRAAACLGYLTLQTGKLLSTAHIENLVLPPLNPLERMSIIVLDDAKPQAEEKRLSRRYSFYEQGLPTENSPKRKRVSHTYDSDPDLPLDLTTNSDAEADSTGSLDPSGSEDSSGIARERPLAARRLF